MIRCTFVLSIVTTALACQRLDAYNSDGHRVIALMSYEVMEEESRSQILGLLRTHPRFTQDFMNRMPDDIRNGGATTRERCVLSQAGVWPEIARGFGGSARAKFHRPSWHYVNLPFFAVPEHEQALVAGLPEIDFDVTDELDNRDFNIVQAIKNSVRIVADQDQPESLRAVHICWLVHIVADAHQALHSTALFTPNLFPTGDRSGNSITTRQGKLHSAWDSRLGRGRSFNRLWRDAREMLDDDELNDCGNTCTTVLNPEVWVQEGHDVAGQYAYSEDILQAVIEAELSGDPMERVDLSDEYFCHAGRINRQRAVMAAFRPGVLLESLVEDE